MEEIASHFDLSFFLVDLGVVVRGHSEASQNTLVVSGGGVLS